MIHNHKGFAALMMLALLPVLLAGGILSFMLFGFLRGDLATLNTCRAEELGVQSKVGRNLQALMKLNPQAAMLRTLEQEDQAELAAALAAMDPEMVALAEADLHEVQAQRQELRTQQRFLIDSANQWLRAGNLQLQTEIQTEWRNLEGPLGSWLKADLQFKTSKVPTLAVTPDLPDTAPVYRPAPNFEQAQTWVQTWRLNLQITAWARNFLPFTGHFDRTCASSLYSEGDSWIARLKRAKF